MMTKYGYRNHFGYFSNEIDGENMTTEVKGFLSFERAMQCIVESSGDIDGYEIFEYEEEEKKA